MIIKTLWIKRKCDPDFPAELIEAWDENSIEENYEGWREAVEKALDSIGDDLDQHRYLDIDLSDQVLMGMFATLTTKVKAS